MSTDFQLILTAVGLAMDACAVAAYLGSGSPFIKWRHILVLSLLFGGMQGIMPLLGITLGKWGVGYVVAYARWISAAVFGFLGGRMLWTATFREHEIDAATLDWPNPMELFALAVATSIDALAAGATLVFVGGAANATKTVLVIGGVTGVLVAGAAAAGRTAGPSLGRFAQWVGGACLFGLGVRSLMQIIAP